MKKIFLIFSCILCFFVSGVCKACAENEADLEPQGQVADEPGGVNELDSNSQVIKEYLKEAQEGRVSEYKLKDEIKAAEELPDPELVAQLKEQLKLMHQEHAQSLSQKRKEIGPSFNADLMNYLKNSRPPKRDYESNPPGGTRGPVGRIKLQSEPNSVQSSSLDESGSSLD